PGRPHVGIAGGDPPQPRLLQVRLRIATSALSPPSRGRTVCRLSSREPVPTSLENARVSVKAPGRRGWTLGPPGRATPRRGSATQPPVQARPSALAPGWHPATFSELCRQSL